jgi:hypothetical protein
MAKPRVPEGARSVAILGKVPGRSVIWKWRSPSYGKVSALRSVGRMRSRAICDYFFKLFWHKR